MNRVEAVLSSLFVLFLAVIRTAVLVPTYRKFPVYLPLDKQLESTYVFTVVTASR